MIGYLAAAVMAGWAGASSLGCDARAVGIIAVLLAIALLAVAEYRTLRRRRASRA